MRITLRQIAKLAHVSVPTASKALHYSKEVNAQTAAEVWEVAQRYGYISERKKAALLNQKDPVPKIAILRPELVSLYYTHGATEIARQLEKDGASTQILVCNFDKDDVRKTIERCMESMEIDGAFSLDAAAEEFNNSINLPYVQLFRGIPNDHRVRTEENKGIIVCPGKGMTDVMDDIIVMAKKRGYKRFAFIGEKLTYRKEMYFKHVIEKYGLSEITDIIRVPMRFEKAGYSAMKTLLDRTEEKPLFVMCGYDDIAIGAMKLLRERGLRMPEDVGIVGMDNISVAEYVEPALTTIGADERGLYAKCSEIMLDAIFSDERPKVRTIYSGLKLFVRRTFF